MPNKFHSLLASKTEPSLLNNLNLPEKEEQSLKNAAREIKMAITQGFAELRYQVRKEKLDFEVPKPKFAVQGSYIYGTLNAPAYPPGQQVDIDLGVYLPFSVLGNGRKPKTATGYYFQHITRILMNHIASNDLSWEIPPEHQQKPTCIRVILNDRTHIDLPLYAVPKGELNRITEDQSLLKSRALNSDGILDSSNQFVFDSMMLESVDPNVIHMAHREEGWKPSDALVIRDWVQGHFKSMGAMIRPVNRFLKAWRDEVWRNGGEPSSILLLAHSLNSFPRDNDGLTHCQALEAVIEDLPNIFDRPLLVPCPTSDDKDAKEDLISRISKEKQNEYREKFQELKNQFKNARQLDPIKANEILIKLFGKRLPNDPSRIEVVSERSEIERIKTTKPDVKPLYTTERSNSG